jgi:hypothetical protein
VKAFEKSLERNEAQKVPACVFTLYRLVYDFGAVFQRLFAMADSTIAN